MANVLDRFSFTAANVGCYGLEEEIWTVRSGTSELIAVAPDVFARYPEGRLKPELPIHQIEATSGVCVDLKALRRDIEANRATLAEWGREFGFDLNFDPMPPSTFPIEVYPKPRYLGIRDMVPAERLVSAWVTGVHVHIGAHSFEHAFDMLNRLRLALPLFVAVSGCSPRDAEGRSGFCSARMLRYAQMAGTIVPPHIRDREHFVELAEQGGFAEDPRKCWWGVRVNPVGSVEVRVFDSTPSIDRILAYAGIVKIIAVTGDVDAALDAERIRSAIIAAAETPRHAEGELAAAVERARGDGLVEASRMVRALVGAS